MNVAALSETRISQQFARARATGRKVFIAYLTAGDPGPEATERLVLALERAGVDVIELGLPFSDPIADGPVIQRASDRALRAGMTLSKLLGVVHAIRRHSEIPLVLFSYLNPLLRYGFDRLARDAASAGLDGVLMTDLCVEEAMQPVRAMREAGLATIFLAAPTSTDERLRLVAQYSAGFIYLVSRTGVTGVQQSLSSHAKPLVKRMRAHSDLPLALGFGIGTPDQVAEAASVTDGVVVGSALVSAVETYRDAPDLVERVEAFTRTLTAPLAAAPA